MLRPPLVAVTVTAALVAACDARLLTTGRVRVVMPAQPPAADSRPPPVVRDPVEIAGTEVVRVGVNFEDQGAGGDRDYNDAVLCFAGHFKVDGSTVIATEAQDVVATTSSISDCRHTVRVDVYHPDGRAEPPIAFDSASNQSVRLRFELGSRLEVSMQGTTGGCDQTGRSMHEPAWAQILLDQCNTTGR